MHDPMTVAFEIRWPWFWDKYRPSIVTIWHVDPEVDGSDDSCGWSSPRLTQKQRGIIEHLAFCEVQRPWFQRDPVKCIDSAADAESLMRGLFQMVACSLRIDLPWQKVCEFACRFTHNSADNFRGSLCHLPGWHTNFPNDDPDERKRAAIGLFSSIARIILRYKRPWYRHPRWHIHHWKVQVHPVQAFKRWAFSRCEYCGGRFRWGESPCSYSWHGTGPKWFKSEPHIHHAGCNKDGVRTGGASASAPSRPPAS